jgi:asparagine synthase (glutamine-hydrolysing)
VIAAVWDPLGRGSAEKVLQRLGKAVGAEPDQTWGTDSISLGAWSLAPIGRLDSARRIGWIGTCRTIPDCRSPEAVLRTSGDYALVAEHREGLLAARGKLAGRSLYYAYVDGMVLVCSRLEALRAMVREAPLDRAVLAALIAAGPTAVRSSTPFSGLCRLRAAEALVLTRTGAKSVTRGAFNPPPSALSPEDLADQLRGALRSAVGRAMGDARNVAVMVSGGLDSSCVLANAVANAGRDHKTRIDPITLSFAGPGDDRPYLATLCDSLGVEPVRVTPEEAMPHLLRCLVTDAAPLTWPTAAWEIQIFNVAKKRGAEVVLTGIGGDHVFAGTPSVLAKTARDGHLIRAVWDAYRLRTHWTSTALDRVWWSVLAPLAGDRWPAIRKLKRRVAGKGRWPWARGELRQFIRHTNAGRTTSEGLFASTCAPRLNGFIDLDFLEMADHRSRVEAASGCTRADPLLDDEVVELVASIPPARLLDGNRTRGLFRRTLKGLVPDQVRLRQDKGSFEPALVRMMGDKEVAALRELSTMQALSGIGLIDPKQYRLQFEKALAEGASGQNWLAVWPALAVEAFVRWNDGSWPSSSGSTFWADGDRGSPSVKAS